MRAKDRKQENKLKTKGTFGNRVSPPTGCSISVLQPLLTTDRSTFGVCATILFSSWFALLQLVGDCRCFIRFKVRARSSEQKKNAPASPSFYVNGSTYQLQRSLCVGKGVAIQQLHTPPDRSGCFLTDSPDYHKRYNR